jgi:hypothetical protein
MQGLGIETAGPDGRGALDPEEGRVRLVQIRDREKGRVYDADFEDPRLALRALTEPVAHNATFEYDWISRHFGVDLKNLHDTDDYVAGPLHRHERGQERQVLAQPAGSGAARAEAR